ncbi:hypothetical protein DLJ49_09875 [Rhodovulum sp. 12E13]|uniref:hypothetical protein n=1 Tax=Rhodovulum sp. 12E13 TaxID=2203891 RepID=UPI000E1AB564|nr:hypothetical protein [Rhodovulum sp. 12E13]RDC72527.1 hypothetical protein DLJ49_09875 [Rhodovulum sp. 12E13]
MIVGYLLLGWIGGATAAGFHLAAGGSMLGAAGIFVGVGNIAVIALAALAALRAMQSEARATEAAFTAPLPAFPRQGGQEHLRRAG